MRRPTLSLTAAVAVEAACVSALRHLAGPLNFSFLPSLPLLQMPVSSYLSSPAASACQNAVYSGPRQLTSAAGVRARASNSLFVTKNDADGGVLIDFSLGPSKCTCACSRAFPVCLTIAAVAPGSSGPGLG